MTPRHPRQEARIAGGLIIPPRTHRRVRNFARLKAREDHKEAGGAFFVRRNLVNVVITPNRTSIPCKFRLFSRDVMWARSRASGPWGTFHSHPISEARLSDGDKKSAFASPYCLIYDVIGDTFGFWYEFSGKFHLLRYFDFNREWLFFNEDDWDASDLWNET